LILKQTHQFEDLKDLAYNTLHYTILI
jgi:hypothetical protein